MIPPIAPLRITYLNATNIFNHNLSPKCQNSLTLRCLDRKPAVVIPVSCGLGGKLTRSYYFCFCCVWIEPTVMELIVFVWLFYEGVVRFIGVLELVSNILLESGSIVEKYVLRSILFWNSSTKLWSKIGVLVEIAKYFPHFDWFSFLYL